MKHSFSFTSRFIALLGGAVLLLAALPTTTGAAAPAAHAGAGAPSSLLFVEEIGPFGTPGSGRFLVLGADTPLWLDNGEVWVTVFEPASEPSAAPVPDLAHRLDLADLEGIPQRGVNLRLRFEGANPNPTAVPFGRQETVLNYYLGSDPSQWRTAVPVWAGVRYVDLYPGLDLIVEGTAGGDWRWSAECTLADCAEVLAQVRLQVEGAEDVRLDDPVTSASVVQVQTAVGAYEFPLLGVPAPDFARTPGSAGATVNSPVEDGAAEATGPLAYGTFLGGSGHDYAWALALDATGAAFVAGHTFSLDFPTTPGVFDSTHYGDESSADAFVVRLAPDGGSLLYATFLGGKGYDWANALAVDATGAAFVAGSTISPDFPIVDGAFDATWNGGLADAFVARLAPDGGMLEYATFLGGSQGDRAHALALDATGSVYVAGESESDNFPATQGAFDATHGDDNQQGDAFVVRLAPDGGSLLYATFLGGKGHDAANALAVDATGTAFVTGDTWSPDFPTTEGVFDRTYGGGDVFVTRVAASGRVLLYSTLLGGSGEDTAFALALDENGATIAGLTGSGSFPITQDAFDTTHNGDQGSIDAFVARLAPDGSSLLYSTFLGGSEYDRADALAVDSAGTAFVAGATYSADFPTTDGAFDGTYNGGETDVFVVRLSADGESLLYATLVGGTNADAASAHDVDASGAVVVAGETSSANFPTTEGAFDRSHGTIDAFVTRLFPTYTIGGRVTLTDTTTGLPRVPVLAGNLIAGTDADGSYTTSGLLEGTYSVSPFPACFSSVPFSRTVTLPPPATGVDFSVTPLCPFEFQLPVITR